MPELIAIPLLPVVMTLAIFRLIQFLQQKFKSPLLNPILVSALLILGICAVIQLPLADYQTGMKLLSWLLTPATICLAVPMYEQFQALRKNLRAILVGVAAGTLSCLLLILGFGLVFGFDPVLTLSLMPKGITTAIGVALTELMGGMPGVTTAGICFTGIFASVLGPSLCRMFRITDPVAQGVAFGTAAHVIGTSKATELNPLSGAVGSLSLVVAGLLTAVTLPLLLPLMG